MDTVSEYIKKNSGSRWAYKRACESLPSGCSRNSVYYPPFPVYLTSGRGTRVWDVDGNERIDFNYNNSTLVLGHNHQAIVAAVLDQLTRSTVLGSPTEAEVKLAEELLHRLNDADKLRFTPSGTEANLQAVRLARSYTGKDKIAKCEGCYHGSWDAVDVSVGPSLDLVGPREAPNSVRQNEGIPSGVIENTIVLPFNDPVAAETLIRKHKNELAAVIIEPCWRDNPPNPDFLKTLREVTESLEVILIFDEVISFRVSPGGAQRLYGVTPDITTMGKIIGGGFPVGAYASTDEVMKPLITPESTFPSAKTPKLAFSGTFNAHPVTMAAGIATMKQMQPQVYEALNETGQRIRNGLNKNLEEAGVVAQIGGVGSLFNIAWTKEKIIDYRTAASEVKALGRYFSLSLMNKGIFLLLHPNVSAVATKEDLDKLMEATRLSLEELKPIIKEHAPNLLKS